MAHYRRSVMNCYSEPRRLRPLVALYAVSRLIKSRGEDRRQAMIFIRALEGESGRRAFERLKRTLVGQRLLRDRPRLLDTLIEAEATDRFPPGTLGHAYRAFLRQQNMSVAGLMDLATSPLDRPLPEEEAFAEERSRVMHDLWHVATDYDASTLGEVCLMAFRCAQVPHLGFRLLTLFMLIKPPRHAPKAPVRRAIVEAYRMGKAAVWLRGADWEALLPMELTSVRRLLGLRPPETYHRVLAIGASQSPASGSYEAANSAAPAT
jgi:ubiquinone biosynthesis protein COQ4